MRIARAVGGSVEQAFPWPGFVDLLRDSAAGLHEARRGTIVETFRRTPWTALLEQRGWWTGAERPFDAFWAELQEKGGWWDPIYYFGQWDRIFKTRSGRFEFYSLTLKAALEAHGGESKGGGIEAPDQACLPHFEPPRFVGDSDRFPFHVNVTRPIPLAGGRNSDQPFLQEILDPQLRVRWNSWVEINPQAAEQLGIADGEEVWLESPVGKIRLQARFNPGAMPHVINVPANLGHTAYGRFAKGIGVNPMHIVADEYDRLGGFTALGATRVRVSKA